MVMSIFTIILMVDGFIVVALFFIICCSLLSRCANQSSEDSEAARHNFKPNSEEIRQLNNEVNVNVSITQPTIRYENEIKPNSGFRYDKSDGLAKLVLPEVPEIGKSNNVKHHLTLKDQYCKEKLKLGKDNIII